MTNFADSGPAPGFQKHQDYALDIFPSQSLHQVIFNEAIIAASNRGLIVREQNLRDIVYIPETDILVHLTRMKGQSSYCPFKGTASYWTLEANGAVCEAAAWSYDNPFREVSAIQGHIAFYLDKMDCYWRNGVEQPLFGPGRCQSDDCISERAA